MRGRLAYIGFTLTLLGCAAVAGGATPSAKLQLPERKVFVGAGSGMVRARDGMPLYAGNRVITAAGAKAEIVYSDSCILHLSEDRRLDIASADQCRTRLTRIQALGVAAAVAAIASQVHISEKDNPPISR